MRHLSASQRYSSVDRFRPASDVIEWEELPSMANSLAERLVNDPARRRGGAFSDAARFSAWDNTMPADLLVITPSQPFQETLSGLAMREVHEPDVFRHFFGGSASA
jgi:hypothetical protein